MAEDFERIAAEEGSTKSELFRRMFRLYQSYRAPRLATDLEDWAERLISEANEAERAQPLSQAELKSEIGRAQRYGARRLQSLGITSEQELKDVPYGEEPASR